MAEITMPKMSDAMEEGTVIKWLKHEGDQIEKGEPIAEIETEKATLEIESFETGVIQELKTKEGETVPVGTPIAVVATDGKPAAAPVAEAPPEAEKPPEVKEPPPAPPPEPPQAGPPPAPPAAPAPPQVAEDEERIKASPLAQKMAKDAGLDLREMTGTGPGGRIVEADVREHLEAKGRPAPAPPEVRPAQPPPAPPAPAPPPAAEVTPAVEADLSRIRKTVAKRMSQSKQTIPHFYVTSEVKMDEALKMRASLNEVREENNKISVTDLIVKACAIALIRVPEINASWQDEKLQYHQHANVAIAVALDEGLIAPVVPECDVKSLSEIAVKSRELVEKARSGQIRPEELSGATFTISNLGMFDVEDFVAIIVPPESAILAIASAIPRPVVVDGHIDIVQTMKITISADHRVTDGVGAARFLKEVKRLLESPYMLVE